MILQKERFLIRCKEEDIEYVNNFDFEGFKKEYEKMKKLFGENKELPNIRICFLYSPEEYNFFTGDNYQEWKSACTGHHTTIFIFSPGIIEKYTIHKKESIFGAMVHELAHLFYGYSKLPNFLLFNEGIAEYFRSKNKCEHKINFKIPSLKGMNDMKYNYGVGHLMIYSIIRNFGEEEGFKRIIEFLRSSNDNDSEDILSKRFEKIFSTDINRLIKLKGGEF